MAVFGLLLGAVCWGIIWFPYRIMAETGVTGVVSTIYTYVIAIPLAGIYFAKHWRGVFKLPISIVWLAITAGWTNLCYVLAVIDGEVMRVMLLFYLSPLWTLILAHFWLKEKTTFNGYIAIVASLLGAFIMLHNPQMGVFPLPRNTAEWLGLIAGVGFSLMNVIARKSSHLSVRAKSMSILVGVLAVSLMVLPFVSDVMIAPSAFTLSNGLLMLLIAALVLVATLAVQYGVTKITATRASVLFLFELVVAAVASYYLAHETMAFNEWLGGSLIVVAGIFAATHKSE